MRNNTETHEPWHCSSNLCWFCLKSLYSISNIKLVFGIYGQFFAFVVLKNKDYFTNNKRFIWEQQIIAIWDKQAPAKAIGRSSKQRRGKLFHGEKEEVEGQLLWMKVHCRKAVIHLSGWQLKEIRFLISRVAVVIDFL